MTKTVRRFFQRLTKQSSDLLTSKLYSNTTFYPAFLNDLRKARSEVIIECPFITRKRLAKLLPLLRELRRKNVRLIVNTRHPDEYEDNRWREEVIDAVSVLQDMGILVLYTGGHHRKLAIIDRVILWEGSLNILSQNDSCEIMRRTHSATLAAQMLEFTGMARWS